jgi:hypothetical protein
MHARGPQVKVALGRLSLIVDDSDRKLSQRRVGLLLFLKCGVEAQPSPHFKGEYAG